MSRQMILISGLFFIALISGTAIANATNTTEVLASTSQTPGRVEDPVVMALLESIAKFYPPS